MKKILVVNIGTEIGGIEKSLIAFLQFLVEENYDVFLAIWKKPGALDSQIPSQVVRLDNLGPGNFKDVFKKGKNIFDFIKLLFHYVIFKIAKIFKCAWKGLPFNKENYDVAISFCQNGYSPFYVIDKVNAKRKLLFYHHGSYEQTGKTKIRDSKYFSKYDYIVAVSESNKIMLKNHFPEFEDKIKVVGNLVDETLIKSLANEPIDNINAFLGLKICTVGRLSSEKGHDIAIDTAKILKDNGIEFKWFFIGEGPMRNELERKVDSYNLKDYCCFLGEKINPYPYIKQSDLYVQTSKVESYSLTVHEANILGKPIIASDLPAIRELLSNGRYGVLCEMTSEAFAQKIAEFYNGKIIKNDKLSSLNNKNKNKIIELL